MWASHSDIGEIEVVDMPHAKVLQELRSAELPTEVTFTSERTVALKQVNNLIDDLNVLNETRERLVMRIAHQKDYVKYDSDWEKWGSETRKLWTPVADNDKLGKLARLNNLEWIVPPVENNLDSSSSDDSDDEWAEKSSKFLQGSVCILEATQGDKALIRFPGDEERESWAYFIVPHKSVTICEDNDRPVLTELRRHPTRCFDDGCVCNWVLAKDITDGGDLGYLVGHTIARTVRIFKIPQEMSGWPAEEPAAANENSSSSED